MDASLGKAHHIDFTLHFHIQALQRVHAVQFHPVLGPFIIERPADILAAQRHCAAPALTAFRASMGHLLAAAPALSFWTRLG